MSIPSGVHTPSIWSSPAGLCQTARYIYARVLQEVMIDACRPKPNKQTSTHHSSSLVSLEKVHSGPSSSFESNANDEMQMRDKIHKTQDLQDLQDLITAEDNCGPVGLEPEDSVN